MLAVYKAGLDRKMPSWGLDEMYVLKTGHPDEMYVLKTVCKRIIMDMLVPNDMVYHGILILSIAVFCLCVFSMYVCHVLDNLQEEIRRERLRREIRDEVVKNV